MMIRLARLACGLSLTATVSLPACSSSGGAGGSDSGPFRTAVLGDRSIGSLSRTERDALCSDEMRFASESTYKADVCRFGAALSAGFRAAFSSGTTDAELRATCSEAYSECLNGTPQPDCARVTATGTTCTATVSELTACLNDEADMMHTLASALPDCTSISAASLAAPPDGVPASIPMDQPKSCDTYRTKCPGIPDVAKSFADEYCALVEPCCTEARLGSRCNLNVYDAAQDATYDQRAGAACLDALRQRQSSPGYCLGLESGSTGAWAVIPPCEAVFVGGRGGNVAAPVEPSWTTLPTTSEPGHACVGTSVPDSEANGPSTWTTYITGVTDPSPESYLCEHDTGLVCDDLTHVCRAGYSLGAACDSLEVCDADAYCDFSNSEKPDPFALPKPSTCAARRPPGASCAGNLVNECAGIGYCDNLTLTCATPGAPGAACSEATTAPRMQCLSGVCRNGTCASRLASLCGN